jgi:O-antigen/teichoic acid export membrane protein
MVRSLFASTTRSLALMAVGPALILAITAPILFGPVFGHAWSQAGVFVAILVPSYYLEFVIGATGDVLYVLERQGLHLGRELLRFCLIGGAVPVAAALHLPAVGAVAFTSLAGCVAYAAYGLISWRAVVAHRGQSQHAGVIDGKPPDQVPPLDPQPRPDRTSRPGEPE